MKKLTTFLWFCAGAYPSLLKKSPTESYKYVGIGGTVLFTAIFAGLAAGYALHTVFDGILVPIVVAVVWALMIFNLDRYIVGTMRKTGRKWHELKLAFPRFLLACILALVIAKPLELKVFEKEVNQQLDKRRLELLQEAKTGVDSSFTEAGNVEERMASLKAETEAKRVFRDQKQKEYDEERFGIKTPGTSGRIGLGTNARKKEEQLDLAQSDYQETERRNLEKIAVLETELARIDRRKQEEIARQGDSIDRMDGLAARLQALADISSTQSAVYLANIFIILLFVILETAPILVKWISEKGPYDVLLELHEKGVYLYAEESWHKTVANSKGRLEVFDALQPNKNAHELEKGLAAWGNTPNPNT